MPKNLVFCADGTWNGPGQPDSDDHNSPPSNVFKLFLALAGKDDPATIQLAKEQERTLTAANGAIEQITKYIHGVGDSSNWLVKVIGGGFGAGLIARIVRGYTFISRNYTAGDKIYLVGFSRGAYTARALAGLISAKGLLSAADPAFATKEAAYRAGSAVWQQWRSQVLQGDPLDHLGDIVLDLPGFLQRPPDPAKMVSAPIETVAVWDTVGALGIPIFTAQQTTLDVFQFADKSLSVNVKHGRHAISIDEQREDFTPTLWGLDPANPERIIQVLFPGAHADVGGSNPITGDESGLSDCALDWMSGELRRLGVAFADQLTIAVHPQPAGPAHEPWREPLFAVLPRAPRNLPPALDLSQSVIERLNAGAVHPDPSALPTPYHPANIAGYLNGRAAAPGVSVVPYRTGVSNIPYQRGFADA
jgi:uncharacterized protein (DUF2235 family)